METAVTEHVLHRNGIRLVYDRRGRGPLIVLVQGLGVPGEGWLTLPDILAEAGFAVVTPDNRGTGRSSVPRPPYRMAALGDDLAAVIADADAGPALLVGISLGGMIVQHAALDHPDLVAGLVLAATHCGFPFSLPHPPSAIVAILKTVLLKKDRGTLHTYLAHADSLARDPDVVKPLDDCVDRQDPVARRRGFLGQVGAAAFHATGWRLPRLRVPAEVITGDDDRIAPPVNSRTLARLIPNARFTEVPRTGHVFPLEDRDALPAAVLRVAADIGWYHTRSGATTGRGETRRR